MVVDSVIQLNDRHGSSIQAIRKYIQLNFVLKKNLQAASFNSLTLKAISKAVAMNELEKHKSSYKVSKYEKDRVAREIKEKEKEKNRRLRDLIHGKSSARDCRRSKYNRRSGRYQDELDDYGSSSVHNRLCRKELAEFRSKRDTYLLKRSTILLPFIGEHVSL
jgi:hypothetical protein